MSTCPGHYWVLKGSKTGAKPSTYRRAAAPTDVGRVSPRAVPSLKLGLGTCVPRPAAPVRGHGGDASNGIDGRGAGLESVVPVYRSREERGDNGLLGQSSIRCTSSTIVSVI